MQIPDRVRQAYALDVSTVKHVPSLINDTFIVNARPGGTPCRIVVQRLHPVFGREVHRDIEAVTSHLAARGQETPRLVRTADGELDCLCEDDERPWRALMFVAGVTVHRSRNRRQLESAAARLGDFHRALADLEHEFESRRPLHDTPRHLATLKTTLDSDAARGDDEARALGSQVLEHADDVRQTFEEEPSRVVHGDPKLSNLLFFEGDPLRARCLVDLDTVGRGPLALELGDAMRSWCNPSGEDTIDVKLERPLVQAVLRGYLAAAPEDLREAETTSVIQGLETVSCELASRFAADAVRDSYFGWDPERFSSRREHNLVRARAQLALSREVRTRRDELLDLTRHVYPNVRGRW